MIKKIFLFLLLVNIAVAARTQLDSMMQVYALEFPQQKLHLHFDKTVYRAGETIWFKAYLFEGIQPSLFSNNLYAEMIDEQGKILQRKVYPLMEASAAGSFDLPDTTQALVVNIRAYTTWMLNFDTAFLYQKKLTILAQTGEAPTVAAKDATKPSLRFFAEGGSLVNNVESVIAFKANDSKGLPVKVKGTIVANTGEAVTTFETVHNGMGKLLLTPAAGKTYLARWQDEHGQQYVTDLPAALSEGVVLSAEITEGRLLFKIHASDNSRGGNKELNLVAHLAQMPVYKTKINLPATNRTSGSFPIHQLPTGVLQITLFSNNWQPLAERVVLVNNNLHLFNAQVQTPVVNTTARAKNIVEVEVEDTLLTNLSLAITDADLAARPHDDNILSRLLLTGDLKGYVHEPGYYFSDSSARIAQHLDLVMLTHGWRKFVWRDIVQKRKPRLRFPNDPPLMLQAKVFGLGGMKIPDDEQLLAIVESKDSTRQMMLLPKTGTDSFAAVAMFYDTAKVYYQFQKNRSLEKTASILLQNSFIRGHQHITLPAVPIIVPPVQLTGKVKEIATEILKRGTDFNIRGNVLQTVVVTTRARSQLEKMDADYTHGLFKGIDGQAFDMTDPMNAGGAFNIFSFLQGRVAGLQITNPFSPDPEVTWRREPVALFLDEMQVDANTLSTININDIAYVKTFRPPFMGARGGGSGGAIAIYTKKGTERTSAAGLGLARVNVPGYSAVKEFYSPDYSQRASQQEVAADFRTTLLWKPYLLTDLENNKVKVEFYNNDITKAFRIVLEGVNEVGQLIRIEKVVQ